jgi:MFS family permease
MQSTVDSSTTQEETKPAKAEDPDAKWAALIEEQGGTGPFQKITWLILALADSATMYMSCTLAILLLPPEYKCQVLNRGIWDALEDDNLCRPANFCEKNDTIRWELDETSDKTLQNWFTEYKLECQPARIIGMFGSLYFVGDLTSTMIFTPVIDYYGRKRSFWAGRFVIIVVYLAMISLPTTLQRTSVLGWMYALILLLGLTQALRRVSSYYFSEMMSKKDQSFYICMVLAFHAVAICVTALYFKYVSKQWRWLYLTISAALAVIMIIGLVWIPESPRYLYTKGRMTECKEALLKMGRFNGKKEQPLAEKLDQSDAFSCSEDKKEENEEKWGIWAAVNADSRVKRNLIVMMINWPASMFSYYLVIYTMKYLNGDVYMNLIGGAVADVISCYMASCIIEKAGIKNTLIIGFLTGMTGMSGLLFYSGSNETLIVIMVSIAVFGNAVSQTSCYTANQSIFDIKIVAASYNVCNFTARIATIIAP